MMESRPAGAVGGLDDRHTGLRTPGYRVGLRTPGYRVGLRTPGYRVGLRTLVYKGKTLLMGRHIR